MLQSVIRNRETAVETEGEEVFEEGAVPALGLEMTKAARYLHDALDRMEHALATARTRGAAEEVRPLYEENQILHEQCERLGKDKARLEGAVEEMKQRNEAVSARVTGISAQLEALIKRLGSLLQE